MNTIAVVAIAALAGAGVTVVAQPAMQRVAGTQQAPPQQQFQGGPGMQQGGGMQGGGMQGGGPGGPGGMQGMGGRMQQGPLADVEVDESKLTCIAERKEQMPERAGGMQQGGEGPRGGASVQRELGCRVMDELGITPEDLRPQEGGEQGGGQPGAGQQGRGGPGRGGLLQRSGKTTEEIRAATKDALASMVSDGILTQEQADAAAQALARRGERMQQGQQPQPGQQPAGATA